MVLGLDIVNVQRRNLIRQLLSKIREFNSINGERYLCSFLFCVPFEFVLHLLRVDNEDWSIDSSN